MLLHLGRDREIFTRQDRGEPLGCPGPFVGLVDPRQRLERDRCRVAAERPAKVVPFAADPERRRADRAAMVEREDLRRLVAAEFAAP